METVSDPEISKMRLGVGTIEPGVVSLLAGVHTPSFLNSLGHATRLLAHSSAYAIGLTIT
jgi:hypothetical protein